MSNDYKFPATKSVIYWPIGTGDSTSLVLKPGELVMQIDLHHLEKADNAEEPEWPIIDFLVKALPRRNGQPYLAVFVLTHPDQDHVRGFEELLKRVEIGELWHTPKVFRDQSDEEGLCEDAKVFRKEADRRRKAILAAPGTIKSGDRLRVIGHDDILSEDKYKDLPPACKSRPGEKVALVDGVDVSEHFQAFIHAPFKDDQAKDKNNTSLSLNVVLWEGDKYGQFFFFGDREYPTIKRIFETTEKSKDNDNDNTPYLNWNVMLCPHHCSKAVMYWQDEGDKEEVFKQDIMDFFEKYAQNKGYVVASAHSNFSDEEGKNPPHLKARKRYEEIVESKHFICTHEHPSKALPEPVIFLVDKDGFQYQPPKGKAENTKYLGGAVMAARGGSAPPKEQIGFGAAK